jgi:hypothetical protein
VGFGLWLILLFRAPAKTSPTPATITIPLNTAGTVTMRLVFIINLCPSTFTSRWFAGIFNSGWIKVAAPINISNIPNVTKNFFIVNLQKCPAQLLPFSLGR